MGWDGLGWVGKNEGRRKKEDRSKKEEEKKQNTEEREKERRRKQGKKGASRARPSIIHPTSRSPAPAAIIDNNDNKEEDPGGLDP